MSKHVRVRSISPRSIRGLYFRKGAQTWRVDRIGYAWPSVAGHRRFAVKIDGVHLQIAKEKVTESNQTTRRHARNLTLADFNPSPLGRYAWRFLSTITSFLEPYFRPVVRTCVIACLRVGIQWLPKITQALSFDVHSLVVAFDELPGARMSIDKIGLHSALALTYLDIVPKLPKVEESKPKLDPRNTQGMGMWKKRMADSLQRSFDNALGDSRGTATFSLEICNVLGTMPRTPDPNTLDVPFLRSPGDVQLELSVKFNPKEGAVEPRGLQVSLKIGDCVVKVDLLTKLLDTIIPKKKARPPPLSLPSPSPMLPTIGATPLKSSTSMGSQYSPAVHSAARSFSASLFSPSSLFSPTEANSARRFSFSPSADKLLSPKTPKSPMSPFFSALSASMVMRQRLRRHLIVPPKKLVEHKDKSRILALHSIQVSVASVTMSIHLTAASSPYRTILEDISLRVSVSEPADSHFHREHIPPKIEGNDVDSDAYTVKLSLAQITLERQTSRSTPLARVGTVTLHALAHQWPAPFLTPMPFMSNDPNTSFLGVQLEISDIHMSDQIKDIQDGIEMLKSRQGDVKASLNDEGLLSPKTQNANANTSSYPVPRLAITVECGPVTARATYDVDNEESSRAIELRSNGFSIIANSEYRHPTQAISRTFPAASSVQSLHFISGLSMNFDPTLVRIRSARTAAEFDDEDVDFLDEPPLLSIGTVEVTLQANAIAQIDGGFDATPIIDQGTLLLELSVMYEAICVELWHPTAVDAALCVMSLAPPPTESQVKAPSPSTRFSKLPDGLTARLSVARFVVCITAPDINPLDSHELSRGFSLRTACSVEYSSLRPNQDHWFKNIQRANNRIQLLLPTESVTDALKSAKSFGYPHTKSAFVKFRLSNFVFSAAVATQYEPDDPAIAGRDDIIDGSNRIIHIDEVEMAVRLSYKSSPKQDQHSDSCDITLKVPLIRAYFQLHHAYSIFLALQTVSILKPPRPITSPPTQNPIETGHDGISVNFHANLPAIQVLVTLPTQKLVIRTDGLSARSSSGPFPQIKCTKIVVFSALPEANNRWEEPKAGQWAEFVTLQGLDVSLTKVDDSLLVSVDGESGHLRIADGFVLSDLIHDASVAAKAIKHLAHMSALGCYSDMPNPAPEGPKHVPHVTVRLATLCLEAQDDPFESNLALIWQTGEDAVKQRLDREEAFKAKVTAIVNAEPELSAHLSTTTLDVENEYQFSTRHTVSIQEARKRLNDVHALDWVLRLQQAKEQRSKVEHVNLHRLYGTFKPKSSEQLLDIMNLPVPLSDPPLVRVMMHNLCLTVSPPSFNLEHIADVMYDMGSGLPKETQFSLLVPLHIHFTLSSFKVTLRDYPLPLLHIPARPDPTATSWTFDTDLIIAEEMGTDASVDWVSCPIIDQDQASHGENQFSFLIPKTIMPVKTYAAPIIKITTTEPTVLSWGVSYGPAIQDLMRVVETLSSAPRDSSPAVGFWDKMRLVLHWTIKITFCGDIRLYMKGSRDPRKVVDDGTGFVLCWSGNPEIRVGHENLQKELIQVLSDSMLIAIPNLDTFNSESKSRLGGKGPSQIDGPFLKVCARLSSGVRYGIGFILERACGAECLFCIGSAFDRKCRYFSFLPHYEVKLELKSTRPKRPKDADDSYNQFRSDFIHLSISLACFTNKKASLKPSSLYLSPKMFAHFWAWSALFDGALTLPIRQGNYHPSRPISPKLGRHLATIKYRISLPNLYFFHGYIDGSRETWVDGVTPWVGLKGKVDELLVDMHQREEESVVPGPVPDTTRTLRKKPFYAAEVVMKGLELRATLATFSEPLKQSVDTHAPPQKSNYRKHTDLPTTPATSIWHDLEDFIELDWAPKVNPALHLIPFATCPHFAYFKKNEEGSSAGKKPSKFGSEHSHICLLGKEPSVTKTQINLASSRAADLRKIIDAQTESQARKPSSRAMGKMINLLEDYVAVLKEVEIRPDGDTRDAAAQNYHMPSDIVSTDEWAEFDNVYQIHCPSIFMDSALRDIMMQYYYCSRDRRGFEYHMSTRAVKFIRDQAKAALSTVEPEEDAAKERTSGAAQMASTVLRKILKGENSTKIPIDVIRESNSLVSDKVEPMDGWTEGVTLRKSHCCLLLKPQIILRGEGPGDKCVVAAAQAKLQSFAIMDLLNLEDPISGKVMSRNYTSISGLQAFAPTDALKINNGAVPLEVLIDLRCESDAFERLVPQTDAIFHYDKFNRLRLRNNTTSSVKNTSTGIGVSHLHDQTDLIRVHIPRFTVSANAEHFCAISNIVTKLLLFSDPAHKTRLDRVETMVFKYDFSDLISASKVVSSLQGRLRDAVETERLTRRNWRRLAEEDGRLDLLHLQHHIFSLTEELGLLFDAIKMAQDRFDDSAEQKAALLLHASSSEISWRMLDPRRNLLSKLVMANINFHWLSRQDSSTVNYLSIENLSAFDGSRYALWTEILTKHDEPSNHPLLKRGLFLLANWTILAPVGGITIYEVFELSLHPLRLQIDAKVGRRIMAYIWPDSEQRNPTASAANGPENKKGQAPVPEIIVKSPGRSSIDSPRGLQSPQRSETMVPPAPPLRKLGSSRSFTDLRTSAKEESSMFSPTFLKPQGLLSPPGFLKRTYSSESVNFSSMVDAANSGEGDMTDVLDQRNPTDDAQLMKTRSSQKTFVSVKVASMHILLSVVKEGSFECHDAKIKTRELEYRNQTWSFEELVQQFIPSDMSWRGWVKMAFHQPLVPVLPVARELLSKTKWTASSKPQPHDSPLKLLHPRIFATDDDQRLNLVHAESSRRTMELANKSSWRHPLRNKEPVHVTSLPLTEEPEPLVEADPVTISRSTTPGPDHDSPGRKRVKSLFSRKASKSRGPQ